jgi:hypothetical protein
MAQADMVAECRSLCQILKHLLESDPWIRNKPTERVDVFQQSSIGITPTEQVDLFQQASIGITLRGNYIESCLVGSPAHSSRSIHAGDKISHINETPVTADTVRAALIGKDIPGSMVCLHIKKQSGDTKQVLIQRTSTLALAEKRKMSNLITKLRQNALLAHDNATLRLLNDLEITWDSVALSEADQAAAQAAAVRQSWDTTRTQAAQHLASLRILLDKLDVSTEPLTQLNRSTDTFEAREKELENEIRSLQVSLALAKPAAAMSQSQEEDMQHELQRLLQMQKLQQATESVEEERQAWQQRRIEMEKEIAALGYYLAASDAMIRSQQSAINELKLALVRAESAKEVGARHCSDCVEKERSIYTQQCAIDRLTAALLKAEESSKAGAAEGVQGQDDAVAITMKLGMDLSSAGDEGTIRRVLFYQSLLLDMADATAVPPSRLSIKEVAPGSKVVSVRIGPDPFGRGPSAEHIANELTQQAADPKSKLRSGKITCYTEQLVASSTISPSQTLRDSQEQLKPLQEKVCELEK